MLELNIQNFSVRMFWNNRAIANGCVHHSYCIGAYCFARLLQWQPLLEKWVWYVAMCIIVPESFIFTKDHYHSRTFSRELEKVDNSQKFSFVDYSCYTVYHEPQWWVYNRDCHDFLPKL